MYWKYMSRGGRSHTKRSLQQGWPWLNHQTMGSAWTLPEPGTGETYKDIHISPDLQGDKRPEIEALNCEYKQIFIDKLGTTDLV